MANQKTYTIEIAGVKESFDNVSKLADVLDRLTDKTVKVSGSTEKTSEAMKKHTSATDELGKVTKKLQEFDADYEKEVQRVKSELSAQKKEVSELIKQEQAQAVVDEKQLNSYADKQKYLTSLNKLIRTHANVTDEDKEEIRAMVEESAKLQAELKAFDEEMKIYTRNVGNYPGAAQMVIDANKSMKQQMRELRDEMAGMLANGVDKTDPKFQALAKRAGALKDALGDASDEITHFASDTRGLDNVINLAQTATSVWGLYSNAMSALGIENEEVSQSMERMMAIMSTLQELQTLQNALTAQGSATMKVYETVVGSVSKMLGLKTAATQADTVATTTSTVATKALSVALRAIPLMFVIGLVVTLITQWESVVGWFRKTFPILDTLGRKFKQFGGFINTVKAVLVGFGKAILNWVVNPVKTLANVLSKVMSGDFSGAMAAVAQGIKNQFKGTADAFKNGFKKQVEKGLEDITLKSIQEGNKQTQQELAELKIRERNNKTYSKKYIELQKKDFNERKKLAKGNKDELNKIKLEEMQFDAECEDKKTSYAKQQQKSRTSTAKDHAQQRKKIADDAAKAEAKAEEERLKKIEEATKKSDSIIKQGIQLQRKTYEEYYKEFIKLHEQMYGSDIEKYLKGEEKVTKESLENDLETIQQYAFRRKMLVYQTLADEANETKITYKSLVDDISKLIDETSKKAEKASGTRKAQLQEEVDSLQRTLKNVQKSMEDVLGDYSGDADFTIPLTFDTDAIIKRFNKIVPELSEDVQKLFEKHNGFGALTDFLQNTGKQFEYMLKNEGTAFKEYLITIAEILNGDTKEVQDLKNGLQNVFTMVDKDGNGTLRILGELPDSFVATKKAMQENSDVLAGLIKDLRNLSVGSNIAVDRLNILGAEFRKKWEEISKETSEGTKKAQEDSLKEIIATADKLLNYNDKVVKKFQEAANGIKIEAVKVDDAFTKTFDGQIMSIDKTLERYDKLRKAFEEYQKTLRVNMGAEDFEKEWKKIIDEVIKKYGEGSEEWASAMNKHQLESIKREEAEKLWQDKLNATLNLYGKDSTEYKLLLDEKAKNNAQYALEYEKTQGQIQQIDSKTNSVYADYAESLGKRIQDIYKAFSENMFEPLADGFTALLDYQIEEAEKRLEDVEELLDKAVELREESEEKIEEINDKLKESGQGNTEALKQQLADEMVLLVQRQQNERDLQKQKEREEALIRKKEKQQTKIELGQKLIESIVNTALGVTAALKYGPILGPIFAAIIGAMGALQTGIIVKQMSKLEKGGLLKGKSHKQGGMRVEGTNIEVEGGEYVVNKKSTKKYINLIEAINEDNPVKVRRLSNRYENGGVMGKPTTIINNYNHAPLVSSSIRKFADGGQLNYGQSVAAIEQNTGASRITEAIQNMNFEPVVAVRDIVRKTNDVAKVVDLAGGNLKR